MKVGDVVKVINTGKFYSTHRQAASDLGLSAWEYARKPTTDLLENIMSVVAIHGDFIGVQAVNGEQYIYSIEGLEVAYSKCNENNYITDWEVLKTMNGQKVSCIIFGVAITDAEIFVNVNKNFIGILQNELRDCLMSFNNKEYTHNFSLSGYDDILEQFQIQLKQYSPGSAIYLKDYKLCNTSNKSHIVKGMSKIKIQKEVKYNDCSDFLKKKINKVRQNIKVNQ